MRAGAFDCGERWVRVDGRVCGLMYVYRYCTAWEESFGGLDLVGGWRFGIVAVSSGVLARVRRSLGFAAGGDRGR